MTPIKWNGSAWVDTTIYDSAWYNYTTTDKQWANAKTADGSYWVWIPRYGYQITTNYHVNTTGTINVKFLKDKTNTASDNSAVDTVPTYLGSAQTNYIVEPAFTFGSTEIYGMWVAKFEASAPNASSCYTSASSANCNVTTLLPKSIPNVYSWRYINASNAFVTTRNMETNNVYGWGTSGTDIDTHLIKATEWGAATYLSKSPYGQNTNEIWINPANNYTTGCAGDSVSSASTVGCLRTYETTNGQKASTTGNIYGVYDLSGGAYELVAGYINNGNANLTANGSQLVSADPKYKILYPVGSPDDSLHSLWAAVNVRGDAMYETTNNYTGNNEWFSDYSIWGSGSQPFYIRGGYYNENVYSGPFSLSCHTGGDSSIASFRPVILVDSGL